MNYLISKFLGPILRSWKTSLAGVAMVATGVAQLAHVGVNAADGDINTDSAVSGWGLIMAGIAAISARDANVSSSESGL